MAQIPLISLVASTGRTFLALKFSLGESLFLTICTANSFVPYLKASRAWDGANANGERVASGVYLVRMETGVLSAGFPKKPGQAGQRFVAARKMVLAR